MGTAASTVLTSAGLVVTGCLALTGCGLPGTAGGPTGATGAPSAVAANGLDGGLIDQARSLAAQANSQAGGIASLAAGLGVPLASLTAGLGGQAPSAAGASTGPCTLATPVEISAASGVPVRPGVVAGSGTQCRWDGPAAAKGTTHVVVRVTAGRLTAPRGAARAPGVPGPSYLAAVKGGWQAGASRGAHTVLATVTGPRATRAGAAAVLQLTLTRL